MVSLELPILVAVVAVEVLLVAVRQMVVMVVKELSSLDIQVPTLLV